LCGAAVERIFHDYGNDITVFSFDENGYWEPGDIRFQLKATERIQVLQDNTVAVRIQRANLVHWLRERVPVILSVYDVASDKAYWVDIKAYFRAIDGFNIFAAGATISVRVPLASALDQVAMRELIAAKNAALSGGFI
jgi:hypothetical protein